MIPRVLVQNRPSSGLDVLVMGDYVLAKDTSWTPAEERRRSVCADQPVPRSGQRSVGSAEEPSPRHSVESITYRVKRRT